MVFLLTLEVGPRADTHARPFGAHGLHDGIDDLEREAQTILDRPSVLVRPVVGYGLQELVQKVPIGRMHLDAVETGFDRVLGRLGVQFDVLFELCGCQFSGDGRFVAADCDAVVSNGTCADDVKAAFFLEDTRTRDTAQSP